MRVWGGDLVLLAVTSIRGKRLFLHTLCGIDWGMQMWYNLFSRNAIFLNRHRFHTRTHFVICLMSVNVMTGLTDKPCWSARKMVSKNEKWPETFFFVVRRPPLSTWWNASLRHLRMWDGKFFGTECTNAQFLTLRWHRSHFFSSIVFRYCVQW